MTIISADKIVKRFNDQVVLDQVSFTVQEDQKIGLVGRNGSGKTTLFEVIAGRMAIDAGQITRSRSCRVDYIEQELSQHLELPLLEYVASAREDLLQMRHEIRMLQQNLSGNPHNTRELVRLGHLQSAFESEGGFGFESEIGIILAGLGFPPERHRERLRNFSGGEKNRAGLARALAGNGSLLLLDEPTNHLDIESTVWLEEYLKQSRSAYVIVSHDRAFLTATVGGVWEIGHGKIDFYVGGFEEYLRQRTERRRLHEHRYQHQQEEIRRIEDFVRRNIAGQKTKQAQSRLKYLNRIKRLVPMRGDGRDMNLSMQASGRSFAHVLSVSQLTIGYGQHPVLKDATFDIYRGDKVGLIGRNGAGKTTLLRSLIGELAAISGEIRLGAQLDVAYFDQELSDLEPQTNVLDSLWEVDPTAEMGRIRSFLARFGFTGEDCFKLVGALSGGEKTKLCLARLLYHPANFIIFDEPTNHLDLDSREVLETALREFDGSCLIVSHDRHFLDQVVDRVLYVNDGALSVFEGNFSYFQEKTAGAAEPPRAKPRSQKEDYLTFKEQSKRRARHKKQLQSVKSRIADLERSLARLDRSLRSDIPKSDWEKLHEASERKKQIEEQLLDLYATLEALVRTTND